MSKIEREKILKEEFGIGIGDKVAFDLGNNTNRRVGIVIDLVPMNKHPYTYIGTEEYIPDSRLHNIIWDGCSSVLIYVTKGKRQLKHYYNTPYIIKKIRSADELINENKSI